MGAVTDTALATARTQPTLRACRVGRRRLSPLRRIVRRELCQEIDALAHSLRGLRVFHLNATPRGGGVAD